MFKIHFESSDKMNIPLYIFLIALALVLVLFISEKKRKKSKVKYMVYKYPDFIIVKTFQINE